MEILPQRPVNFIAKDLSDNEWKMVLVEQGPWLDRVEKHLRALQERLYGCVDAVLDGQLAQKFPKSKNKNIVIQVDCYNLQKDQVQEFFDSFSENVFKVPDYREALELSEHAKTTRFLITFDSFH